MFLTLKNVGKIATAAIEIDAITVIAGENNSGKSTVGKILFCVFNSFFEIDKRIRSERIVSIMNVIVKASRNVASRFLGRSDILGLAETFLEKSEGIANDRDSVKKYLEELLIQIGPDFEKLIEKERLDIVADEINEIFNISEHEILVNIIEKKLQAEFNMQINNLRHLEKMSEIALMIKGDTISIDVINNKEVNLKCSDISLNTEVIYIDDPYAIDDASYGMLWQQSKARYAPHREHLRMCLFYRRDTKGVLDEIVATKKLDYVMEKLNSVAVGEIVKKDSRSFAYKEKETETLLNFSNVSTGIKTFAIVKSLLLNGHLEENGTIVLDEPEIHLHPEWQLVFAELIVLIQKEFNMHILLNTHSPYFLNAIEVYSRKHGISEKCRYYLASNSGETSTISDVTTNIEAIYEKLAAPLQTLENERYSND